MIRRRAGSQRGAGEVRKVFFFEKKKQKTFDCWARLAGSVRKEKKVFWFFFSKKNILPS